MKSIFKNSPFLKKNVINVPLIKSLILFPCPGQSGCLPFQTLPFPVCPPSLCVKEFFLSILVQTRVLNDYMKHILNKAAASFPEKVSGHPLVYKQTPRYRFSLSLHALHYSGGFPTEQHKSCWQRLPVLFCHHLPAGGGATHTVGSLFVKNQQVQIVQLSTATATTAKIQQRKRGLRTTCPPHT